MNEKKSEDKNDNKPLKGNVKVDDPDGGSFKFPGWSSETSVPLKDVTNTTNFGFSE